MADAPKKLMSRKQLAFGMAIVAVGANLSLVREYRDTGAIATESIVISAIATPLFMCIVAGVYWYANKPEERRDD
jgi:hypothetical protein